MSYRNIQIIYLIFNELFGLYRNFESLKLKKNFFGSCAGCLLLPRFFSSCRKRGYSPVVLLRLLIAVASLVESVGSRACRLR